MFAICGLFVTSCADENLAPIITFDQAGKGAYIKRLDESPRLINLFNVAGSTYTYSVEFVDFEQGNLVSEYNLDVTLRDNTPDNGSNVQNGPFRFRSYSASEFGSTDRGFKGLDNIAISANDLIAAAGTTADALGAGDVFQVRGSITLTDGSVFAGANSSAAVRGSAFAGHFDFDLTATCPSTLAGTYQYEGSAYWCNGGTGGGTVDMIEVSAGVYRFSDWSFGGYGACYGAGSVADSGGLTFEDVCNEVTFTGFTDDFGDTWTYISSIDGDRWTIQWDNTYGENGTAVIINNGGPWPISLK